MCSGSEAGSYVRLIDFVYHSTLGVTVIKKEGVHLVLDVFGKGSLVHDKVLGPDRCVLPPCIRYSVFGIRVSAFGFRISGFGFRVSVSGFGFRYSGFGFRVSVSGFGFRFRFRVQGSGFRVQVSGFRVKGLGFRV